MSEPSEDEELNYLRTKLLLLGAVTYRTITGGKKDNNPWCVTQPEARTYFRFKPPYNVYYKSELEALHDGIRLMVAGVDRFEKGD